MVDILDIVYRRTFGNEGVRTMVLTDKDKEDIQFDREEMAVIEEIRKKRANTGKMKFGEDWSGVFIRGDDALGYTTYLTQIMPLLEANLKDDLGSRICLQNIQGLLKLLSTAEETKGGECQELKPYHQCRNKEYWEVCSCYILPLHREGEEIKKPYYCIKCDKHMDEIELMINRCRMEKCPKIKYPDDATICDECNQPFVRNDPKINITVCPDCRREMKRKGGSTQTS